MKFDLTKLNAEYMRKKAKNGRSWRAFIINCSWHKLTKRNGGCL